MKIQSKKTYLTSVRNKMLWHFKRKQIRIALENLSSYFETGTAKGKSEKELCNELGSPDEYVEKLYRVTLEDVNAVITKQHLKMTVYLILSVIIVLILIVRFLSGGTAPLYFCIPVIICSPLLWFFLGGGFMLNVDTISLQEKKQYFIACDFLLLCGLTEFILALLIRYVCDKNDANMYLIPKAAGYITWLVIVFSIMICFLSMRKFYKGFCTGFGITVLSLSTLCSSLCYYYSFLKGVIGIPGLSYILFIFVPNIIGFIISIIYYFIIVKKTK